MIFGLLHAGSIVTGGVICLVFAAWTAGLGMIHALTIALLWGSGWLFRTATKDKLLLQVCERYHCPVYFSSVGVHMDGIDSFCHKLSS